MLQVHFFKFIFLFYFDKMVEYVTEPVNPKLTIPNPAYNVLTYKFKMKIKMKKSKTGSTDV